LGRKRTTKNSRTGKGGGYSNTRKKKSKIQHLEIESQIKLVGEDIIIAKLEVDIKPLVFVQVEIKEP
jgi:hypothetical protein